MLDIRDTDGGVTLRVRVQPRAPRDELLGERARLVRGAGSRDKVVSIAGVTASAVRAGLQAAAPEPGA